MSQTIIFPTVGRVVWFRPNGAPERLVTYDEDQPFAAIVTHVRSDRLVHVAVFGHDGAVHILGMAIQLLQADDPEPAAPQPY